jgi:glutamate synthase domain-containing protein 3
MISMDKVVSAADQHLHDKSGWHGDETDEEQLKRLLQDHNRWTGSKRARELLDSWDTARAKFVKVFPSEYKRALAEIYAKKQAVAAKTLAPAAL